MKRFLRTIPGKSITLVVCLLSAILTVGCIGGALWMAHGAEANFYTHTEEEIVAQYYDNLYSSEGWMLINEAIIQDHYYHKDDSFVYIIMDSKGNRISGNVNSTEELQEPHLYNYMLIEDKYGKWLDWMDRADWVERYETSDEAIREVYSLYISLEENSPTAREYSIKTKIVHIAYELRYAIYGIALAAVIILISSFITLLVVAGKKPDTEEVFDGPFSRIPYDLYLAICCGIVGCLIAMVEETRDVWQMVFTVLAVVVGATLFLGACMSTAVRIKKRELLKNTVVFYLIQFAVKMIKKVWQGIIKFIRWNGELLRNYTIVRKTVLLVAGVTLVELFFIVLAVSYSYTYDGALIIFWIVEKLVLVPSCLYFAISLKKLQAGGEALAKGNLSFVTDTKGLVWDLKKHGENLNSIATGMAIAVEDRLKSERMKTELITNVSHDIKTPLTSIINYASLIGNEPCENQKITEYSEVLLRQSERLKRLIEDLVEASKASTGNLEVNLAPCDASVFLSQAAGEYEEKLTNAELQLVTKDCDGELRIMADGRRMWRVFDNLMNNICKYAQSGTRVYLTLEKIGNEAVFTFKNTSREALNVSEEELMERFVRGDASRHTEGNGLGLSIAKSMAELQNGSLQLVIDGDLFKAILKFPIV